jgi:hypothetical protein
MKNLYELSNGIDEIWQCIDDMIKNDKKDDDIVKEHLEMLSWQLKCNSNDAKDIEQYRRC